MRIVLAFIGFVSVFFAPAWVPLIVVFLLSVRYPAWEAVLIGVCLDVMWLPVSPFFLPIATSIAIVIVWACEPLRRELLVGDEL